MTQKADYSSLIQPSKWSTRNGNLNSAVLNKVPGLWYSKITYNLDREWWKGSSIISYQI